jgi:energy-coupling factor transporter ATP-binding protein EcfA2
MLKLRRLRIEKFRNVVPGTEIRFSDGLNVLLGQNGTGKTTLLELISSVVRSNFVELQGEEFSIEYELVVGEVVIVVALHNRQQTMAEPFFSQDGWRPSMEARIAARGATTVVHRDNGHLRVDGAFVDAPELLGPLLGPGVINTTIALHGLPGRRDLVVPFLANDETVRFDESLDVFRIVMTPGRTLAAMHVVRSATDPTPFLLPGAWPTNLTLPRSLAVKLEPLYQSDPAASRFVFSDRDLEFLGSAVRAMGFDRGQASIDVLARRSVGPLMDHIELGNLAFRFQFEEGGDMVFHDRLSYGQKRLLTFFCYLDMCPDIVIADELVNGLHHAWIDAAIAALGERQSFLTSQNPLLLDYLPITSPEQVRKGFIFCRSERSERRPRWMWENMSAEDALELLAAYELGIEHVSEILQSRGLW